jgi:predicted nucleic acid-binding protein
MMCRHAVRSFPNAASCELATGYRRTLPTGEAQWDSRVVAWLEREKDRRYTSAVVIAQLAYWVRSKEGRRRRALQVWLTKLIDALQGRIHGFNVSVTHAWAEQELLLEKSGNRMPVEDSYIAATARRYDSDRQRQGFPTARPQSVQSVQRAGS